eukprot:gene8814-10448_t
MSGFGKGYHNYIKQRLEARIDGKMEVAIVGAGPGGLALALALARRSMNRLYSKRNCIFVTVYDRDSSHFVGPRSDPDRSYTIDITGHGKNAVEYLDLME